MSDVSSSPSLPSQGSSVGDPTYIAPKQRQQEIEEYVYMQFARPISTHRFCFICMENNTLRVIPLQARLQVFIKRRIYIPQTNRCCQKHLIGDRLFADQIDMIVPYSNNSLLPISELNVFLDQLSLKADATLLDNVSDFSMPEEKLRVLTGYTWEQIIDLRSLLTSMRKSPNREVTQALVVFLYKFRSGTSNAHIAAVLGILYDSVVSIHFHSVVLAFERDILPKYFGVTVHSRADLIDDHTSRIARELFDAPNALFLICDGTYLRHEKSANNSYQRKSYSGQKKQHLIKPFTVCCSDGFIADILGPYTANKNDATILREALEDPTIAMSNILRKGDYFVLDRGFRDVKSYLEDKGFKVLMPALKGKRKQLSSEESNYTRFVTKLRWVVEARHGEIGQKFRLLHNKLSNNMLDKADSYCRIGGFLVNKFGQKLNSDSDKVEAIVQRMKNRRGMKNTLQLTIEDQRWERRKSLFQPAFSGEILDFPVLDKNDLELFFTGSYQLKQSISYLAELMEENQSPDEIPVYVLRETQTKTKTLRCDIQSRHKNSTKYHCFIKFTPNHNSIDGILEHWCGCANGARTVGCCSHIATMIYFLSFARYQSRIVQPSAQLTHLFDSGLVQEEVTIQTDSEEED